MPRLLKNKIKQASGAPIKKTSNSEAATNSQSTDMLILGDQISKRRRVPGLSFTTDTVKLTKNIVINYGRAISSFCCSKLALTYLRPIAQKEKVKIARFQSYIRMMRETIGGISSFRSILVATDYDTEEQVLFKKIFRALAEIFIKYFSVNWIIHGRMGHKDVHLKYRYRMLRRIQDPEHFTYLKDHRQSAV